MVAFLGMGLLGSNFVRAMRQKGIEVQVWNRTAERAKVLETYGAKAFENIKDAVKGASRIHITVSDDAAVNSVLEMASPAFEPGVIIIDHTTTTATGAAQRTQYWKEKGVTYQHAPVFMGPQNALESSGIMMASGDKKVFDTVEKELSAMTGKLIYLGEKPERAAGFKLMGNLFLISMTGGLSDTFALAKALDIPTEEAATIFDWFNPGAMVPARVRRMMAADYDNPSWELNMARKDARLMMEEAKAKQIQLTVIPAIAAEMDRWIGKGMGNKDWSVIAKENLGY